MTIFVRGLVRLCIALLCASWLLVSSVTNALGDVDPHRPTCSAESCKSIERFLKSHYCGESPFGNGPDNGCDIRTPRRLSAQVVADFDCKWDQQKQASSCKQVGQVGATLSQSVRKELHRLGLPQSGDRDVHYRLLSSHGLWVVRASYDHLRGSDLWLCELVAVFSDPYTLHMLHEVRFQKTDADVPNITSWSPLDIADVNGDGQQELVLQGDAYEDHWLEVVAVRTDLSTKLLFSGLGYYL